MPETIHGYDIIRQKLTPKAEATRAGRVILVDKGAGAHGRYITAWQGRSDKEWDMGWRWGHYFNDFKEANEDYEKRAKRGY